MTEKEKRKLEKISNQSTTKGRWYRKDSKILSKELEKYFQKRGYEVSRKNFEIHYISKRPPVLRFQMDGETKVLFQYGLAKIAREQWLENDLSLFKTLKITNHKSENGSSFKEFLKDVKKYCKNNNLYHQTTEIENDEIENER